MAVIAIVAQGAMGAGLGRRLPQRGATVLTSLAGRSAASARRAAEDGMQGAAPAELAPSPAWPDQEERPVAQSEAKAENTVPAAAVGVEDEIATLPSGTA